jgi:serine/threonine protein kinase/tetratricopeptide (TPR) repeat protein
MIGEEIAGQSGAGTMSEETLFQEALSFSPQDRAAFLDQACGGRPELRAAVEALLAAHEKSGNILDRPPAQSADAGAAEARSDAARESTPEPHEARLPVAKAAGYQPMFEPGVVIAGHYTLQQLIGEGGMGEVWVARQTEPVKRKVAVKLIKTGMDSKAVVRRFEQERQALALMDHPNIAKVLDGGLTGDLARGAWSAAGKVEDEASSPSTRHAPPATPEAFSPSTWHARPATRSGQPFFVMELVNGLPLSKFCDEARLTTKERLELFVPICQAVQHAHQKGIVHRDLKPANILVTMIDGKPVPKVIDFGVAKATDGKLTDASMSTQFGAVVGTLEYMSPEQAGYSGEDIDTRADIYSLGVILYELLTGLRPLDARRLRNAALTEMIRVIREEEPSKPSTRLSTDDSLPSMAALRQTEPRKLMALLRGELDWVVMKCLDKHRERRYETANGLARDIQHYLADEAIEARPPSAGYRVGKFLKRHRGAVIAASLVVLAVAAGLVAVAAVQTVANARLSASLTRETKANMALADANADLARSRAAVQARYDLAIEAIKTFHTGVSEDFLLKEERFKDLRNRLLKSASDFYGKLSTVLGKETDVTSRGALAKSNFELAELTAKVGSKADALGAHRAVLAAREALAAEPGAHVATTVEVSLSLIEVAGLLEAMGKTNEALATYRRAESLLAGLAGTDPAARVALASCRSRLGYLLSSTGQAADALAAYRQARADQEALAGAVGAPAEARRDLAATVNGIGSLLQQMGKPTEAEAEFRRALEINQQLADDDPAATDLRSRLASGHASLGRLHFHVGRLSEADAEFRTALAIQEKLADDNPVISDFRSSLASSHNDLGNLLWQRGNPAEAEAHLRRALAIQEKLAADNPKAPYYRDEVASCHTNLSVVIRRLGRSAEARDGCDRAIAIRETLVKEVPNAPIYRSHLAWSLRRRGLARRDLGDLAGAAADARRAIAVWEGLPSRTGEDWFEIACARTALASLAGRDGSGVSAAKSANEADVAMALLRKAVAMGYGSLDAFRTEDALDALRQREDFQKLLAELEPKAAAKPK